MNDFPRDISRRQWLKLAGAGFAGFTASGWLDRLAAVAADNPQRKRSCILLWMNGGPSQMETFDVKEGHKNGGPVKEIQTNVPGIRISEFLPKLARQADRLAILRSMSTKEADHTRATYLLRTGRAPGGPIQYPTLGSLIAKELERPDAELPGCVAIAPYRFLSPGAWSSGFLGPQYAPLIVGENAIAQAFNPQGNQDYGKNLKVQDLDLPADVDLARSRARVGLLEEMEKDFLKDRPELPSLSHRAAYQRAVVMMRSRAVKAFDLDEEPKELRNAYGNNMFGQGCLLARRLIERGVPFVEVNLSAVPGVAALGWDTHVNNHDGVKKLCEVLDPAWATLMDDLKKRGLLDSTLIVWMGEFGRTPRINGNNGRDHWAISWSTVLAGGGIKGGQVVGQTSKDGLAVEKRPISVNDLLATVCTALGINIEKQNQSNVGRPIRLVEPGGKAIKEVLA